jgi:hypothetical protein
MWVFHSNLSITAAVAQQAQHLHQLRPGAGEGCTPAPCSAGALAQRGAQLFLGHGL